MASKPGGEPLCLLMVFFCRNKGTESQKPQQCLVLLPSEALQTAGAAEEQLPPLGVCY